MSQTTTTIDTSRWFVIVNPTSGGGRTLLDFPRISKLLHDENIYCEPHFTEHKYHAVELTVKAVNDGYRKIIVLGGDGTLHEVVNGLFIQKCVEPNEVLVAPFGAGSGNDDWLKTFGFEEGRYADIVRAIKAEESLLRDVGVVNYIESQYRQNRYMFGMSGTGFDAYVVKKFQHRNMKRKKHRWSYVMCVIRSFFRYKHTGVKVYLDDQLIYNNLLFSAAIGISKFNGGGIQQLPNAIMDDGLLDMTLIRPLHFWHILFRFRYLFNGDLYRIRHTEMWRGEKIRIESTPEMMVEVDGELLGETPIEFSLLKQAIRIVVSREFLDKRDEQRRAAMEAAIANEANEEEEEYYFE